ncbi:hypothetical protein INT47_010523 [Mucor saturninus]|uniref:Uncharacterized protein n=1 Tax=Mucor saturninus TaxID=64648 RepID=A0A8H7V2W5_9FUNG|nr:hypothetical protein INT47_010523 [Mucor saturninus]
MVGMDSGEGFHKCHVFLQCSPLNGMTDTDLMALLTKCSNEKPIHVMKHTVEQTKLKDVLIQPGRDGGVDVSYDSSQSRLDEHVHSWCTCLSPSPSSNSDENAPVARHRVTAAEDTTVLKRLIDDLKDEIKEDEEMMKRKKRKLAFLQVAYEC